ncbi:hypothetical protein Q5752_005917 [Cryptotrichosporon argae]
MLRSLFVVALAALAGTASASSSLEVHHSHHSRVERGPARLDRLSERSVAEVSSTYAWIGCYADSQTTRSLPYAYTQTSTMTPAQCLSHCAAAGYAYAGVEYYFQCWCGSSLTAATVDSAQCNAPCYGNASLSCGGTTTPVLDVYQYVTVASTTAASTAGTTHLGCYADSQTDRALPDAYTQTSSMTPAQCVSHCASAGYAYAGVEYYYQCWCGNSLSAAALDSAKCNAPCKGDTGVTCGGSTTAALDVYIAAASSSSSSSPSSTTSKAATTSSSTTSTSTSKSTSSTSTTTTSVTANPTSTAGTSFLGCYADNTAARVLPSGYTQTSTMTPAQCVSHCKAAGYTYAGVEYYYQCWCGNSLTATKIADSTCNAACKGDAGVACGGSTTAALDVYMAAASSSTTTSTTKTTTTTSTTKTTTSTTTTSTAATTTAYALSATSNAAATLVTTTTAPQSTTSTKALYAHVIVGNTYGYAAAEWASEIAEAQAAGIDGFAMNLGAAQYEYDSISYAYPAAAAAGFKMFFSFDFTAFSCSSYADGQTVANLINQYKGSSAQATYNGKTLVSTFSGDACYFGQGSVADGWNNVVRALVGSMFLVPSIFSDVSTFSAATWFDGELNWNSGWPMGSADLTTASDVSYIAALGSKTYMPAVSPCFFTYYGASSYNKDWIYRSDNWLLATRMEALIGMRNSFPFVELISWNDFGESHYIGPIAIDTNQPSSSSWVDGFPHTAWLGLLAYYAPALKTGVYPAPTDQLYLWSRPHSKNATPSAPTNPKPTYWDYTDDNLYAIAILASPATVTVTSGTNYATYYLNKGVNKIALASAVGTITGKIVRNGATVKSYDSTGAFSYTATPVDYNFNYFVASA